MKDSKHFKCAFAEDAHFFIQPVPLTCGHYICKSCTPSDGLLNKRCKSCNKRNKVDLRLVRPSSSMNDLMNEHFDLLFNETYHCFSSLFGKVKGKYKKMNLFL